MTAASSSPGVFLGILGDEPHADALIPNDTAEFYVDDANDTLLARVQHNGAFFTAGLVPTSGATVVTASAAELNVLDGVTAGTVTASKAVVVDSNKDASAFRNVVATNFDAGASGTAGTVDVFPTTASKGKLALSVTDQTGNTTVSLVVGAMAAARAITLADPLADADILTGKMAAVAVTANADGLTTAILAAAGVLQFVTVTSANAAHLVTLPTPTPGRIVLLAVGANGFELRTGTPASITLNAGTGASSTIAANTLVVAVCKTATDWAAFSLVGTTLAAVEASHG